MSSDEHNKVGEDVNIERRPRLGVITTHPTQGQVPWFRAIEEVGLVDLHIFYFTFPNAKQQGVGFGVDFLWDIPLRDGYRWKLLRHREYKRSLEHFFGLRAIEIGTELNRQSLDAVIITGWHSYSLIQALLACKRRGIPVIGRGVSSGLHRRSFSRRLVLSGVVSLFDAFLVIGRANRMFYEDLGIKDHKLYPCPYFVDNKRFLAQAEALQYQRGNLRKRWCIPENAICFLYVGKLQEKKRLLDLLEAVRILKESDFEKDIYVLVVGRGELENAAQAKAVKDALPVTFAGFLNQNAIAEAYVAGDCLVLPSDYGETWGLVVNEAMICGKPAIVSDRVGCGPDLIEEGVTGEVFPFGDTWRLSELLRKFAVDPSMLALMGKNARQNVLERYSVQKAVQGTMAAVAAVTGADLRISADQNRPHIPE